MVFPVEVEEQLVEALGWVTQASLKVMMAFPVEAKLGKVTAATDEGDEVEDEEAGWASPDAAVRHMCGLLSGMMSAATDTPKLVEKGALVLVGKRL